MNSILGSRIRSLRETEGLTQKEIAEKMGCSRQKYARIEKGVIDITYMDIVTIAEILAVETDEITLAVDNINNKPAFFRGKKEEEKFNSIKEMIDIFYTHKRLYDKVSPGDIDE